MRCKHCGRAIIESSESSAWLFLRREGVKYTHVREWHREGGHDTFMGCGTGNIAEPEALIELIKDLCSDELRSSEPQ